jgi:pimeloyl-ACP methyl ester carboxylesterase
MQQRFRLAVFFSSLLIAVLCSCKTQIGEGDKAWNGAVDPFRKTADMGGYNLHYIDMGSGDPVVMVHGFADSSYCWHENAAALKDAGHRLIIVDLPGLGRSDIPPEPYVYSLENQAKAVVSLTEKLGLKEFCIVGHSMGGGIALYITLNHPEKIRKAVVIDPVCYKAPDIQILRLPGMEYLTAKYGGRWAVRMGLEDAFNDSGKVSDAMIDEYARPITKPGYWKALITLEKQYYSPAFEEMSKSYRQIHKPVLIIWGKNDTWLPFAQGVRLNQEINNSRLELIDRCGHNANQECKEEINPQLVKFLRFFGPRVDPHLLRPGIGVGNITLGMPREDVFELAGRPFSSTKGGDQFEGFIVRYTNDEVSEILVTSSEYKTAEGISTRSSMDRFLSAYPDAKSLCYDTKNAGYVARGNLYDAVSNGIAYDRSEFQGQSKEVFVTINIHKPDVPANVYGKPAPCEGEIKKP